MEVASFGGSLDAEFKKVFAPFEKERNVTIHWTPAAPAENVAKIAAAQASPEYDVALLEGQTQYLGSARGLWAPIDESIVGNIKNLNPLARSYNNDGVGVGFHYVGLFYRPEEFQKRGWAAPHSWNDLFRPELCGQIGFMHPNVSYTIQTLIMLSGGDTARVPDGIARLATLKDCIPVLEPSAPKLEEKMQLGEYLIGFHVSVRTIPLMLKGVPIKFVLPDEGSNFNQSMASAVKNAPHPKLAQEFLNHFISPSVQKQLMEDVYYGPANLEVAVPPALKEIGVPDTEVLKRFTPVDVRVVDKQRMAWVRQVERAMAR